MSARDTMPAPAEAATEVGLRDDDQRPEPFSWGAWLVFLLCIGAFTMTLLLMVLDGADQAVQRGTSTSSLGVLP